MIVGISGETFDLIIKGLERASESGKEKIKLAEKDNDFTLAQELSNEYINYGRLVEKLKNIKLI